MGLMKTKWVSYKRATLIICSLSIVVALYALHSLCSSLSIFSFDDSSNSVKYTPDQIMKMEESIRIRRAAEPLELVKLVNELNLEFAREEVGMNLSRPLKQKISDEILQTLRSLHVNATLVEKQEAIESWRNKTLQEAKQLKLGKKLTRPHFLPEETGMLIGALESSWDLLLEEIGLWIPVEYNIEKDDEANDKYDWDEDDDNIIPGRPVPPQCNVEVHTDYGGVAVRWGLTHHKESAADCCQACLDQAKRAKPGEKQCNIWVYCPLERGCFSPDIYEHKHQECWLKYAEQPKLSFKDKYTELYRNSHPSAPLIVPWMSGVVSSV